MQSSFGRNNNLEGKRKSEMNFISFEELGNCIYRNLYKVPLSVDLVVGIPRSGTLAGNLLALYKNLPFTNINDFLMDVDLKSGSTRKCKNWIKRPSEAKHVLIVDDSISSGKAMREVKDLVLEKGITTKITYLAVYALRATCHMVDIYLEICEQPRVFEWNYMHHWILEYTCMDIDGVLCNDPTFWENNDAKEYENFIVNATPKIIPTQKVGMLVTGRIEKYREETQKWLQRQGVEYGELEMIPASSARERTKKFEHAEFKAEIYKKSACVLFVESSYEQAVEICRLANKPVLCVENKKMITQNNLLFHMQALKNDWRITSKRVIKKLLKKIDYVK